MAGVFGAVPGGSTVVFGPAKSCATLAADRACNTTFHGVSDTSPLTEFGLSGLRPALTTPKPDRSAAAQWTAPPVQGFLPCLIVSEHTSHTRPGIVQMQHFTGFGVFGGKTTEKAAHKCASANLFSKIEGRHRVWPPEISYPSVVEVAQSVYPTSFNSEADARPSRPSRNS